MQVTLLDCLDIKQNDLIYEAGEANGWMPENWKNDYINNITPDMNGSQISSVVYLVQINEDQSVKSIHNELEFLTLNPIRKIYLVVKAGHSLKWFTFLKRFFELTGLLKNSNGESQFPITLYSSRNGQAAIVNTWPVEYRQFIDPPLWFQLKITLKDWINIVKAIKNFEYIIIDYTACLNS